MRHTFLSLLAFVLGLSLPLLVRGQPKDIVFEHLTPKDGLPDNSVMAMLQDRLGFLWLGTQNGLVKYDGIDMTIYLPDADDPHSIGARFIKSLLEDRSGDLWIGTTLNGLSHFDRATERFTTYRHDPDDAHTLSHNDILFIHEDRAGQLWILTADGTFSYLNRLDPATGAVTRYRHDADAPGSLSHDIVTEHLVNNKVFHAFLEDRQGDLWIGTPGGLNRYNRATDAFTRFKHDPDVPNSLSHDRVASVFEDRAGRFWVGTLGGGLNLMDRATGTFTAYRHDPADANSLSHDVAAVFFEDRAGGLWVTTAAGLDHFDPETSHFTHYSYDTTAPNTPAYNVFVPIAEEDDGHLWLLSAVSDSEDLSRDTQEGKPFRLNPTTGVFTLYPDDPNDPDSFKGRLVSTYLTDRSGVFWLGSWVGGLNKATESRFTQVKHDPDATSSLSANAVWTVYEAPTQPGVLWIGTYAGLDRLDRATGRFTHFQPPNPWTQGPNVVFDIHEDRAGRFWIGTRLSGLLLMDRQTGQFTQYTRNPDNPNDPTQLGGRWVPAILEDRDGNLWFGTEGLDRYEPDTGTFTHYRHDPNDSTSLSNDGVSVLYEDRAGTLWVGSNRGGVSRFNPETETFTTYRDTQNGPISILALYEDEAGRFWMSDFFGGLMRFDREMGTSKRYTPADGLPGIVLGIEEDAKGQLWINTLNGLAQFDPEAETFRTFDVPSTGCVFKNTDGEVFLCSQEEGFFALHPDQTNQNPPQVALTRLRLFNEPIGFGSDSLLNQHVSVTAAVALAHNQNDLTFEYAGLHFLNPEQNSYRYKLENYEDAWRDVGTQRAAIYPNLPPGDYTFRVTAANSDGIWNEEGTSIRVTIHPPWWQTTWAYFLYGLFFVGIVLAVNRMQRRRLIRQEQEKARIREAQLQAEAAEEKVEVLAELDQMKTRFFVNVSHEFRTPLTLILGPLHDALDGVFGNVDEALRPHLSLMQRNGARLLLLINQLLDLSKLEAGSMTLRARRADLVPFLRRIVATFASRAERNQIDLRFETDQEDLALHFEPDKLEKIFVNLLSNAFKFTPEGGAIRIRVRRETEESSDIAEVVVQDSGQGIPAGELPHIFDRFHQVDSSSTGAHEGTGIGLALVKELVTLHGGTIRVESEAGFGTAFFIRLPLGTAHLGEAEILDEPSREEALEGVNAEVAGLEAALLQIDAVMATEAEAPTSDDAPLVLVVEDHDDVRAYLQSHLVPHYRVEVAADGAEGLDKARQAQPALVISDVMMPKMDGYELCRALKTDETLNHIPVILLTARADEESKVEGLETGADDYLYKPFSARELLTRAENLIEIRRRLRQRFSGEVLVQPSAVAVSSAEAAFLERVREAVEEHMGNTNFNVEWLADEVGLSKRQLQRRLRAATDLSAAGYIRTMRLQRAAQLLEQRAGTVSEVAYQVGFLDAKYFSRLFYQIYGVHPSHYGTATT